jgi:predicted metalloprotease with PDZ domain
MPKGLPAASDRGLDNTPTWGRTYWGGAIFWLLADVRIRGRTHNRLGVNDALRAINRSSGGIGANWSVDKVVAVGDGATGTNELTRLYAEMKSTPVMTDLQDLFINLGVRAHGGKIDFDDNAPLADIRRGITAPPTQP